MLIALTPYQWFACIMLGLMLLMLCYGCIMLCLEADPRTASKAHKAGAVDLSGQGRQDVYCK